MDSQTGRRRREAGRVPARQLCTPAVIGSMSRRVSVAVSMTATRPLPVAEFAFRRSMVTNARPRATTTESISGALPPPKPDSRSGRAWCR
jgi:hypothetical protein